VVVELFLLVSSSVMASTEISKPVTDSIEIRQNTQKEEEQWRLERDKLTSRLDELNRLETQLREQKEKLVVTVQETKERISEKENQLQEIEKIQGNIVPLIDTLIQELQEMVAGDLPFLLPEREQRLENLVKLQHDPEITVSEKLRKVLEAMLVETEYGTTIEMYQQSINTGDKDTLVNIFRLGRIVLFYQTFDQKSCGFYNVATGLWQPLPKTYNRSIAMAIDIGAKRRPVELLTLPVGRINL